MHWTEEFFDEFYLQSVVSQTDIEKTRQEVDFLEKILNPEKDWPVLDLACGNGRHVIELTSRGYQHVSGLDLTEAYIRLARKAAKDLPSAPVFKQGNMRDLEEINRFKVIFSLFSSMFYYDDHTNLDILKRIYRALKPGGIFLIDYFNASHILRNNKQKDWYFTEENVLILEEVSHNPISGIISNERLIITPDGRRIKRMFHVRDYTASELRFHFENTGFEISDVFGNFAAEPFIAESPRQIFVMHKPGQE